MPYVVVEKPEIVTISYRQTNGDEDYGSCLWARFNFDTKHYHLSIESDCGSYGNGWYPTPDHETFLQLCSRFEMGYLLDKIDNKRVVDGKATYKALMEFLADYDGCAYEALTPKQLKDLEAACHSNIRDRDCLENILDELEDTEYAGSYSEYDIACCIEMTYPAGSKKIAQIFREYIQPEIRKISDSRGQINENKTRLIDANVMRQDWLENGENEYVYDTNAVLDSIDAQPTVDAVEVVHGRWREKILVGGFAEEWGYVCSECGCTVSDRSQLGIGRYASNNQRLNYCPNCGAKMDGDKNGS